MNRSITIASRGSALALWQAHFVQEELKRIGLSSTLHIIKTQGDQIQDLSFDKLEGKGFFTKEIEEAVLNRTADLAVHSHKDLPTESPAGLVIAAVSYREDPSEMILIRKEARDPKQKFSLKRDALVGTSSARRKSQLLAFRPDVTLSDLRGNVPTRVQKLRDGQYDAILLAVAGLERLKLDLSDLHVEKLDPREFVPAPAQGVLALQVREADHELREALQKIHHPDVQECIAVERKILNLFDGGCQLPLGAYCTKEEDTFMVWTSVADAWNKAPKRIYTETKRYEGLPERIVEKLHGIRPQSVFITRDLRNNGFFENTLRGNGFTVEGKSLIETKPVALREFPQTEWVFFSSKHAVRFFLQQTKLWDGVKLGAVGKGTADELRKFGRRADFIGDMTDTRFTGKKLSAQVGMGRVLFPQAKGSLRTVQQAFPAKQVVNLIVYETIQNTVEDLPHCHIFVFTSPSNVDAFFEKHALRPGQQAVAMGHATASALQAKGWRAEAQPATFDDAGLTQAVFALSIPK